MNLDKLKSLAESATSGPWITGKGNFGLIFVNTFNYDSICSIHNSNFKNAEYITEANPDTILKMIKLIEEQKEEIESLENKLESYDSNNPWVGYEDEDFSHD